MNVFGMNEESFYNLQSVFIYTDSQKAQLTTIIETEILSLKLVNSATAKKHNFLEFLGEMGESGPVLQGSGLPADENPGAHRHMILQ